MLYNAARYIYILQLNGYNLLKTTRDYKLSLIALSVVLLCAASIFYTICTYASVFNLDIYLFAALCFYLIVIFAQSIASYKNIKLKFTSRAVRLCLISSVIFLTISLTSILMLPNFIYKYIVVILMPILVYLSIDLAYLALAPIEYLIKMRYINKAKHKLKGRDVIKIGITGSYGKTSTKNFLDTILSEKYVTLASPKSYNTPMGITKTILNSLSNNHEILILEMGATHKGDIVKLCNIARPDIAILTSIGPQHLATFKTLDNIISTKYEIMQSLSDNGIGVFNLDNKYVKTLYDQHIGDKIGVSTHITGKNIVTATNITATTSGLKFDVTYNDSHFIVETKVLGYHNVLNILLSIAVGIKLGLSVAEMRRGVYKIRPVDHRLKLSTLSTGDRLIDDAFNSNVDGFVEAVKALSLFDGQKILVTPGVIDLGDDQSKVNFDLARSSAKLCDKVIIVKYTNKDSLINGFVKGGLDQNKIYFARSFKQAQTLYTSMLDGNTTVLLENDLPDNYK